MSAWLRAVGDGVALTLHIQPGAKRSAVVGMHGDALKIRLAAPPVDGKANAELLAFLALQLDCPRSQLTLTRGQTARSKTVVVSGIPLESVQARLQGS